MGNRSVLVTGDLVLDCHLYGGIKTAANSFRQTGTQYTMRPGGAALTCEILSAAADTKGHAWDLAKNPWDKENQKRKEKNEPPLPWPQDLAKERPAKSYEAALAFQTADLQDSLPPHMRSYGVWRDKPKTKGKPERVWRVDPDFGYGATGPADPDKIFRKTAPLTPPAHPPILTVIDDGAIVFRHLAARKAWPELSPDNFYLLKMSGPLCRGDLWAALAPVMNRLIVVVAAGDLRREDVQINAQLSWEACAEQTICALQRDPTARGLLNAAHVIVNFGSAGALWVRRNPAKPQEKFRLFFDTHLVEREHDREIQGTTYGFQSTLTAGIAHHLMMFLAKSTDAVAQIDDQALQDGITAGLLARRILLELGHGPVDAANPGFPLDAIGQAIAKNASNYGMATVPLPESKTDSCPWTILGCSEGSEEMGDQPAHPLVGLGELAACHGLTVFSKATRVPSLRLGALFSVDRSEIESFRTLQSLIRNYEDVKVQNKPLSIGVFGPPGAGKSFGVKALAKSLLTDKVPFLEFNLSQFAKSDELIGAFHRVRDAVLGGITPVAFWDEFDSQEYKWLQYLLAPMQDGKFQEGQVIHPIGKCIFIFAGGTSPTLEQFGVPRPKPLEDIEPLGLSAEDRTRRDARFKEETERFQKFVLLKGPDFVSRLHGYLNVRGPNAKADAACPDITWPIRRAIILRGILGLNDDQVLDIDPGLLHALLSVSEYRHGARSFEKIVLALAQNSAGGRITRSGLPPEALLDRETHAAEFHTILNQRDAFKNHPDLESLAAALHQYFLKKSELSERVANASRAWTIDPDIKRQYHQLDPDPKASNLAAARRIPDHLALIDFIAVPLAPGDDDSWKPPLAAAITKHRERLAQAEHRGWCVDRIANGWTYATVRDNKLKQHPLLVDWNQLSEANKDKDREIVQFMPLLLAVAGYKALPCHPGHRAPGTS